MVRVIVVKTIQSGEHQDDELHWSVPAGQVGAMGGFEKKPDPTSTHTEVLREIVKVRCKYCGALNLETSQNCSNCGAHL